MNPSMAGRDVCIALLLGVLVMTASSEAAKQPVGAEQVARLPAPGTVVPGAIAFGSDGRSVTYLKSERPDSLSRVLWRVELPEGAAQVVARPPDEGNTEANVSREEALRRERLRQRDTGITQIVRASKADVAIIPLKGDLYLQRGAGPLERLTVTEPAELDPKPTADGSKVAFVRDNELYVLDIASKAETRLSHGATEGLTHGLAEYIAQEELDRFTGFWWSPDEQAIVYEEVDERHVPEFTITHSGEDPRAIETHRFPFAGAANAKVRIGVVGVTGGETRWLAFSGPEEDAYLARVDWAGPSRLLVQVLDRDQKRLRLEEIDIATGRRTLLVEERASTWVNLHNALRVVEGTGELLWSSERSGLRQLELRDTNGKLVRVLTSAAWPVDSVLEVDSARREAWYRATGPNPTEMHLFRVSLDGGPSTRLTEAPGTHVVTVAPDGSHYVDTFSSITTPPRTAVHDREGRALRVLADSGDDPRLKELELPAPELVTFRNRDGVTLHGAYYAPQSEAMGRPAPLVVMVYGGPNVPPLAANSWGLTADLTAQFLTARGFAVWKCDNRGTTRRGKAFEDAIHLRMGTVEVDDQVDGVTHITEAKAGAIDPKRVGITGGSYGGYMTLRCLELAPETFKAGVAIAPVTDWDGYDTAYTERYMSTPRGNSAGYNHSSVLTHAEKITGALLIIHGMIDENVHFRHSARLAAALIEAGRPFELLPVPEERHAMRKPEVLRFLAERRAQFFERALR